MLQYRLEFIDKDQLTFYQIINFSYTRMLNTINRTHMEKENILNKCLISLLGQKHEKTYVSHFIFQPLYPCFSSESKE